MKSVARFLVVCIAALCSGQLSAEELPAADVAAVADETPAGVDAADEAPTDVAAAIPPPAETAPVTDAAAPVPAAAPVTDAAAPVPVAAPVTDAAAPSPPPAVVAPVTDAAAATPVAASAAAATAAALTSGADAGAMGASGFAEADRLVVHKSKRRLELLKDGAVIAQYPIRLGLNPAGHKLHEGDFRTPEGHYYLSRRNPRSDFFLSIEVSYPNESDRRRARGNGKQPGGSIMIHGQPNVPRKPPEYYAGNDWTDGCIAVSNSDMVDIWLRTRVGLPIDIRP